jgi:hypothetical protein
VYGDSRDTRVLRTEVSRTATGIQVYQGLLQDNYIHDLGFVEGDHVNGITDNGGIARPLVVRHNTVLNPLPQTDAISLFQDFGLQVDRTIEDNLVAGGSYTVYGGAGRARTARIRVVGNRWSRRYFPRGGTYGPVIAFDRGAPGNEFRDNIWDETGLPVLLP